MVGSLDHLDVNRLRPWLRTFGLLASAALAYVVLRALLGLGHELAVAGLAGLCHALVATGLWQPAIGFLGLDPIYAGAAIRAAGGVQVAGLAVAGPIGNALHQALPSVFLASDAVVGNAAISMVAAPGAPALGRALATFFADVLWLSFGLWLFLGWRRVNWRIAIVGALILAQIAVNHLLTAHFELADIDATGLPFAVQVAVPSGGWFTSHLAQLPTQTRDLLLGACLLALACGLAAIGVAVLHGLTRLLRRNRGRGQVYGSMRATSLASLALAVVTALSPVGALALGVPNWRFDSLRTSNRAGRTASAHSSARHQMRLDGATPVSIEHPADQTWHYVVDGSIEDIRGVGYNPWYAGLSADQRTALYDRDFAEMHRRGINTIEGWFEPQFDRVTLDAAARNGIGVLMPFELNQDWDFTNANVRQSILDHVSQYVETYKDHPAVRMWAPGNENLHRVLYAHWVSQVNNPQARAQAAAFAAFLPVLVDRIHELDPNHPVLYRDAEDLYLPWITSAFAAAGGSRPWLVYGANVYSQARLRQIVSTWPAQWPGQALLISEYAPGGMTPSDRPVVFQSQWSLIRSRPDVVLGGLAYTWSTNGPEDLDRVFGLVNPEGVPTDGGLAALSTAYLADTAVAEGTPAD